MPPLAQRARAAALSLWKPSPKGTGDEGKASPLETNPQGAGDEGRGSGSGKMSRGRPICNPVCAVPADAGTH